jgi:hypothetical protein
VSSLGEMHGYAAGLQSGTEKIDIELAERKGTKQRG